jgi:hypothetical protein
MTKLSLILCVVATFLPLSAQAEYPLMHESTTRQGFLMAMTEHCIKNNSADAKELAITRAKLVEFCTCAAVILASILNDTEYESFVVGEPNKSVETKYGQARESCERSVLLTKKP